MCIALVVLALVLGRPTSADTPPSDPAALSLEISALQTLHDLELSRTQLDALAKIARETAPREKSKSESKVSPAFRNTLGSLHDALAKGKDEDIAEARQKLDDLHEKEQPVLDIHVEIATNARNKAASALQLLNVRQVGAFVATLDLTDPVELLVAAVESVRGLNEADKKEEIEHIAEEVSGSAGSDEETAKKIKERVSALLERAHGLKDDAAFKREQTGLEREARGIVTQVDSVQVLCRALEHGMAELLSNPRLEAALKIMKDRPEPTTPTPANKSKVLVRPSRS
jgi:hypothetical protein